jgi:hypothetical protein
VAQALAAEAAKLHARALCSHSSSTSPNPMPKFSKIKMMNARMRGEIRRRLEA